MVAHGTPCLGPITHAGCGAICPAYDRGCYGCFGPKETPNTGLAERLVAAARRHRSGSGQRLPAHQRLRARRSPPRRRRSRPATAEERPDERDGDRSARSRSASSPGSRARARCTSGSARAASRTSGWRSSSRPASSRRCSAAGRRPTRPTSPRGSAGSARSPTRSAPARRSRPRSGSRSTSATRALRRLIYCGEWLESHSLHVFMLHAPDFLGYDGAIEMARDGHQELFERGPADQAGRQPADGP